MLLRSRWFAKPPRPSNGRPIFLNTGVLRDGELELIQPHSKWTQSVMASVSHPLTASVAPKLAGITRKNIADFLYAAPHGLQSADGQISAPAYHFWMLDHTQPHLPIAGGIALRIGHSNDLEMYSGHIGYHVYPPHRGRHFAERATRLLFPLAQRHGVDPIWITCNPDNWASRRTCERLGGTFVQTVCVPPDHPLYARGEVAKCRYRIDPDAGFH
jgi:predicted acetyltransferase